MTTTSDEAALLAAIHANPDDDTVRLAYADCLTESGEPERMDRAELIRVQIDLERWVLGYLSHDEQSCSVLRVCESALLTKHPDWLRATCPACDGFGKVFHRDKTSAVSVPCLFCSGTGHLPLVIRRGFPWRVTVPRLEQIGEERECWCVGTFTTRCPRCSNGRRFAPTDHARALLVALPTCGELVAGDKRPFYDSRYYLWFRQHPSGAPVIASGYADLPGPVFDVLPLPDGEENNHGVATFDTAHDAISALGVTLAALVRGAA